MDQVIRVTISADGSVRARRLADRAYRDGRIRFEGLDAMLIRHFERWLEERDRQWDEDELRSFGMLLHRCLLPSGEPIWIWVQECIRSAGSAPVRLMLEFPLGDTLGLASVPWEYIHTPETKERRGYFLAEHPNCVLSRYVAPGLNPAAFDPVTRLTVLPVVADPDPRRLGKVDADPVLRALVDLGRSPDFEILPTLPNPTADQLGAEVAEKRPQLVHFMGHGRFDRDRGRGSLALLGSNGRREWVPESVIAEKLCQPGGTPRIVVLHACEGGSPELRDRFAGLAPALIRGGVQCVVAMQYAVTNPTAIAFSTTLYQKLQSEVSLDEAVQAGRSHLANKTPKDWRLLGVPVLYHSSADPVLVHEAKED